MNDNLMVPYNIGIFLCVSEIQDDHLCRTIFEKGPFGEKIEKIFFYGTTEPFKEKLLLEYF